MTELPPLYRAAMEVSLEDHGVEKPRVSKDGKVTEVLPFQEKRTPLSESDEDGVFVAQAVVDADVMVGLLSGETLTRGKALLQAMGVDGAEMLYEKCREVAVGHEILSISLRDVLHRAAQMIGPRPRTLNQRSRS